LLLAQDGTLVQALVLPLRPDLPQEGWKHYVVFKAILNITDFCIDWVILQGETVEYVPTLHFHQRHNKPMFWLTHMFLPWAHNPIAR
jgi:hypothetical protein